VNGSLVVVCERHGPFWSGVGDAGLRRPWAADREWGICGCRASPSVDNWGSWAARNPGFPSLGGQGRSCAQARPWSTERRNTATTWQHARELRRHPEHGTPQHGNHMDTPGPGCCGDASARGVRPQNTGPQSARWSGHRVPEPGAARGRTARSRATCARFGTLWLASPATSARFETLRALICPELWPWSVPNLALVRWRTPGSSPNLAQDDAQASFSAPRAGAAGELGPDGHAVRFLGAARRGCGLTAWRRLTPRHDCERRRDCGGTGTSGAPAAVGLNSRVGASPRRGGILSPRSRGTQHPQNSAPAWAQVLDVAGSFASPPAPLSGL
jgi:hypothetical protein